MLQGKPNWRKDFKLMIADKGIIRIGKDCFFNNYCSINTNNLVEIGEGTLFGENVKIYDHNHRFSDPDKSIKEQGFSDGEVHIGSHCWIGSNVLILKGSVIGDNCVIGGGYIVNGEIPKNMIVKPKQDYIFEEIISKKANLGECNEQ